MSRETWTPEQRYQWRINRLQLAAPADRWDIICECRNPVDSERLEAAAKEMPGGVVRPDFARAKPTSNMGLLMRPDILTVSGKYFGFRDTAGNQVDIHDIAHALSHLCRFNGHVRFFYSVAQHSVSVSKVVPAEYALAGLLHDAAEAYIGDVATPLKQLLAEYKVIEQQVEAQIADRFDIPFPFPPAVKHADNILLATEVRDLMPAHEDRWPVETMPDVKPLPAEIVPLRPRDARQLFLMRYQELTGVTPV